MYQRKFAFLLLPSIIAFLSIPGFLIFIHAQLQPVNASSNSITLYRVLLYLFSIYAITYPYFMGKRTVSALESRPLRFELFPHQAILAIGMSSSVCPITCGFFLTVFGIALNVWELYILAGISFVATAAWAVRWLRHYFWSKSLR